MGEDEMPSTPTDQKENLKMPTVNFIIHNRI